MSLGIVQGRSCPDDPGYFRAVTKVIIPYGIDLLPLVVSRSSESSMRILFVGIHSEDKGLFVLLETAKLLLQQGMDFEMHTVGEWYSSAEEDHFLRVAEGYGLNDKISCVGRKTGDCLRREYEWADILFFPTHYPWETMGIVQLEAMAYRLPVVASDWQGPKDVVVHGETGYLCPPDDPPAFADRLQQLAKDAELRERMGLAGRERYESLYTVDAFIERIATAFDRLP